MLEIYQKQPFDIIAMTPRGTFGFCCAHNAQLMTHPSIYTLPFTLQLRYKPVGILQRVTKVTNFLLPLLLFSKTIKNPFPGIWESIYHIK